MTNDSHFDSSTGAHAIRSNIKRQMGGMMTALPGHILTYDPVKQRAQVKIGIKRKAADAWLEPPPCIDVPVQFQGSMDWSLFFGLKEGDEGLIVFSQRAADRWKQKGGIQEPHDFRAFSASDAFFLPGARSDKTALPSMPADGIGLTSRDSSVQVQLTDSQIALHKGATAVTLTDQSVTLAVGGQTLVLSEAGLTHNGVNVGATHRHSQQNDTGGNKEQDTEVPH